jgi:hypothetical protein
VAPDIGAEFSSWVDEKVAEAMQPSAANFAALVERLPGIYPTEILASLNRLATGPGQIDGAATTLARSASIEISAPAPFRSHRTAALLPPHPLDYEWRFSQQAVNALEEACHRCTEINGSVALVGTPTIAACPEALFGDRATTYFGVDTDALRALGPSNWLAALFNVNLLQRPPDSGTYSTVIMDPPWYEEYMLRFLWFAGQIARIGGTLLLAMPPEGTRPGIAQENARLLRSCQQVGFEREGVLVAQLPYDMPPFERNALRAESIRNIHPTWRKADLWQLKKVRSVSSPWPGDVDSDSWSEHRFGRVRLRINRDAVARGQDPRLRTLIAGDVLPTVSRRDLRREQVRVWTTGNRIFGCDAPRILCALLEDWRHERNTLDLSTDMKAEVRHQIDALVQKESLELL